MFWATRQTVSHMASKQQAVRAFTCTHLSKPYIITDHPRSFASGTIFTCFTDKILLQIFHGILLAILFFRHKDFANQPNRNVQQLQLHCLNEQIKCVATNRAENTGRYITEHFIELSKLTYFTLPDAHC